VSVTLSTGCSFGDCNIILLNRICSLTLRGVGNQSVESVECAYRNVSVIEESLLCRATRPISDVCIVVSRLFLFAFLQCVIVSFIMQCNVM